MRYNKFNSKVTYIDNIRFASKRESERYIVLKLLKANKTISNLELHPKFSFPMGFSYIADFSYLEKGKKIVEDVKGMITYAFQLKAKCMRYFYPAIELRVVK